MKKLCVLLILIFVVNNYAQEAILDTNNYKFIQYSKNTISNSKKCLTKFYDKLHNLEEGKINKITIFQFGDSHVAGLSFPNQLEYNFQINFGNLGRHVFSAPVQKTIKKKVPKRRRRRKGGDDFEEAEYFFLADNYLVDKDTSITLDPSLIDEDTTWFSGMPIQKRGIDYYVYGNSGKTFDYFNQSSQFGDYLTDTKPDLAIVTLGTNDAFAPKFDSVSVYESVDKIIDLIKSVNNNCSIIFTTPAESYVKKATVNANIPVVRNIIKTVCKKHNVACWDFYGIMALDNPMQTWLDNELAFNDKIHFTKPGYQLIADMLYVAIMKGYEKYLIKLE